jgi:hypothetical protein
VLHIFKHIYVHGTSSRKPRLVTLLLNECPNTEALASKQINKHARARKTRRQKKNPFYFKNIGHEFKSHTRVFAKALRLKYFSMLDHQLSPIAKSFPIHCKHARVNPGVGTKEGVHNHSTIPSDSDTTRHRSRHRLSNPTPAPPVAKEHVKIFSTTRPFIFCRLCSPSILPLADSMATKQVTCKHHFIRENGKSEQLLKARFAVQHPPQAYPYPVTLRVEP